MRARKSFTVVLASLVICVSLHSQDTNAIQKRLESQYAVTRASADNMTIFTEGAVLVLKKEKLDMVATTYPGAYTSNYKDGKLSLQWHNRVRCPFGIPCPPQVQLPPSRAFRTGEKMFVTRIQPKSDGVFFDLLTDALSGIRFKASVDFHFPKGAPPSADDVARLVSEVFDLEGEPHQNAPDQARQGTAPPSSSSETTSAEQQAVVTPPPPPPPDPSPTATPPAPQTMAGQTHEQVVASFGPPDSKITKDGRTEIYLYNTLKLKVTFVDGKVTTVATVE